MLDKKIAAPGDSGSVYHELQSQDVLALHMGRIPQVDDGGITRDGGLSCDFIRTFLEGREFVYGPGDWM